MDTLKNVGAVQSALAQFKSELSLLTNLCSDLESNKANISSVWESANATSFIGQYNQLINNLKEAIRSFEAYQGKIDAVVQEIVGFDETINNN